MSDLAVVTAGIAGAQAFGYGDPRLVPRSIIVELGVAAAKAWYAGWDKANLAAPVPDQPQQT